MAGAAKVHGFSSHLMDTLLGDTEPTDPYNFAAVGRWYDRVPGGMSNSRLNIHSSEPQRQSLEFHPCEGAGKKDRALGIDGAPDELCAIPHGC